MTDQVSIHIVLEADDTITGAKGVVRKPFIFIGCDPNKRRNFSLNAGVVLDNSELNQLTTDVVVRMDSDDPVSGQWLLVDYTAIVKNDEPLNLGPNVRELSPDPVTTGADSFVRSLSTHKRLLVKLHPYLRDGQVVHFDLTGMPEALKGCPALEGR